jgi:integrase
MRQEDVEKALTMPPGWHLAGRNLYLRVRLRKHGGTTGAWSFIYKDPAGKTKTVGLGSAQSTTLAQAREKARDQHALRDKHKDPRETKRHERLQRKADARKLQREDGKPLTVNDFCREYYKDKIKGKSKHYEKKMKRMLDIVGHTLGTYPPANVDDQMIAITSGLKAMRQKNPQQARDLTRALFGVFELAEAFCKLPNNQAEPKYIDRFAPIKNYWVKPRASIPYEQMQSYLEDLFVYEDGSVQKRGHLVTALWLKFIIFSGGRISEPREATWDEIKGNNWIVPWQHLKSGDIVHRQDLVRPITTQMQAVLDEMRKRRRNDTNLIFPNPDGVEYVEHAISRFVRDTLGWKIEAENIEPTTATAHGTRSTLTAWAQAQRVIIGGVSVRKYEQRLIDIQLNHVPGDLKTDSGRTRKGARAYDPTANPLTADDTIEPRRVMMQEYNDFIWPNGAAGDLKQ